MEKKSNGKLVAIIVLGLLTAFGLIIEILSFTRYTADFSSGSSLFLLTYAITSVLLLYYAVAGYKKPHGNLLKHLFLLFAICCLSGVVTVAAEHNAIDTAYNVIRGIVVLMTAYVAGRLDRFKQNVILMSIIGVLMLASSLVYTSNCTEVLSFLSCFTFFFLWADMMVAYIIRYKEHKEAGLTDKN